MPTNLGTINQFTRSAMSPFEAADRVRRSAESARLPGIAANLEQRAISPTGRELYEAFIRGYTAKQWETDPRTLPAGTISRLPVRYTYDNRYFNDTYQGLPTDGYSRWFERMIDHPNIEVVLDNDFLDPASAISKINIVGNVDVVYTGPLDQYFDCSAGRLGWRTLDFEQAILPTGGFQGTSVVNYSDEDTPFTRVIEFRHLHPERQYRRMCQEPLRSGGRAVKDHEYMRLLSSLPSSTTL